MVSSKHPKTNPEPQTGRDEGRDSTDFYPPGSEHDPAPTAKVTMTFTFRGTAHEAEDYLKSQLPNWGADAIAPYIDGSESWAVDGKPVDIID